MAKAAAAALRQTLALCRAFAIQCMQLFAWLKAHCLARSDTDFGAGAGITTDTGLAGADAEHTKSAQLDALSGCESLLQTLEDRIHCRFRLGAGQARALDDTMDNVLLDQWGNLASVWNEYSSPYAGDTTGFASIMKYPHWFQRPPAAVSVKPDVRQVRKARPPHQNFSARLCTISWDGF